MGIGVLFILQKKGEGTFFSKKGRSWQNSRGMKVAEGGITYVSLLIFVHINPRNIKIPGIYKKVTSFIIYPNF